MSSPNAKSSPTFRSPRRITITLPQQTYERLQQRSDDEGRSLSNLSAFLLEMALQKQHDFVPSPDGRKAISQARR